MYVNIPGEQCASDFQFERMHTRWSSECVYTVGYKYLCACIGNCGKESRVLACALTEIKNSVQKH